MLSKVGEVPRAQMAFENVGSFQWSVEEFEKTNLALEKIEGPQFTYQGPKWPMKYKKCIYNTWNYTRE